VRSLWGRVPARWRFVAGLFLAVKVALTLIGLLVTAGFDRFLAGLPADDFRTSAAAEQASISSHRSISMWFIWDSMNYLRIAGSAPGEDPNELAFPPLYPLLGRLGALVSGGHTAMALLVVSNAAFLVMLNYAYRLGEQVLGDEDAARRFTRYVVLLPAAFLFQAALTESLFLCLVLAAFYYAERGWWVQVGTFGFFAALSRSVGFLLVIPLAMVLLHQHRYRFDRATLRRYATAGWPLVLVPAGWLVFMAYSEWLSGDWQAYRRLQQEHWSLSMQLPWETLWSGLRSVTPADAARSVFPAVFLVLLIASIRVVKPAYLVYGLIMMAIPLTMGVSSYQSIVRYLVVVFPVSLVLAAWAKRPSVDAYLGVGLALLQGALFVLWLCYWTYFLV
jgi:hypothetical protein